MRHGAYGLDILYRWDMQDGMSCGRQYAVASDIKGSPNPMLIEKKCGNLGMSCILMQILYLSQLHVGSTHKMRLPITTGYADKICENRDFMPEGRMDDRLFFLYTDGGWKVIRFWRKCGCPILWRSGGDESCYEERD